MIAEDQRDKQKMDGLPQHEEPGRSATSRFEQFDKRQRELWRLTFLILFVLAIFFAAISWDAVKALPASYEALPIGLVVLVVLFAIYMWRKAQELSELRGLLRGMEQRDASPPSERQMDQLFEVISRSQQGFRDLIDSFDDVLLALSLEGEIRAANRSFADLIGLPFQRIIGRRLDDFLDEGAGEGSELITRNMPRFLERHVWSGIVQVRLKSQQTVFYFECVAHAMVREGKVHGLTVLGRDVTALRKNEAQFTELFETLQEGIYIVTPDDRILDVNPALVQMLGYDEKEELLAKKLSEVFPDKAARASLGGEVAQRPLLEGHEVTLVRKDGSPIVCLNTSAAVRDGTGKVVRYQGALMDITSRREMERRLYKQQEFARRLVDSFPDLIMVLDSGAHYTFISPRIQEVLGYTAEEESRLAFGACTHSEDRPALESLFAEILAGRQSFASLEVRVRHKQGTWRRIRCHFSPLCDEGGRIDGVVISGRDVTELKRLEEQLIQAEKLAAMGQMLAGVAHELNNPLTAILGVTELLRERETGDQATKRQLELTHRQARRAARIVQNLLDFSRPASPQKKPVDLHSIIERTLQLHEHSLRRSNIEIDFYSQPDLPGTVGDANQLIQVFLNLVTNAEHAIREVRDSGRIQVRLVQSGRHLVVTVQDDGVGIHPEALPRLFDPFYTTKRPGGGTGLGLSICASILQEHGGTIEANILPAGGSAFTVHLPVAGTASSNRARKRKGESAEDGPSDSLPDELLSRSVLVLDDEESIRMLLEEGLSAKGLHVSCAATPDEALALVAKRNYDILICDLNLSPNSQGMSGEAATEKILTAAGSHRPQVVYITGDLVDAEPPVPGAPRRLQKPFRISDVIALLGELSAKPAGQPLVR